MRRAREDGEEGEGEDGVGGSSGEGRGKGGEGRRSCHSAPPPHRPDRHGRSISYAGSPPFPDIRGYDIFKPRGPDLAPEGFGLSWARLPWPRGQKAVLSKQRWTIWSDFGNHFGLSEAVLKPPGGIFGAPAPREPPVLVQGRGYGVVLSGSVNHRWPELAHGQRWFTVHFRSVRRRAPVASAPGRNYGQPGSERRGGREQ